MDKELKAQKLGSATVRKQRMQERQRQKELLYEQREDRKRRMIRYSEAYSTDGSDSSRSNSPENDSAADTPSECSIATPENPISPEIDIQQQSTGPRDKTLVEKDDDNKAKVDDLVLDRRHEKPKASMFTASLNRPCDFRYDRFSTFMDPADAPKTDEESCSSSASEDEQSDDEYSPIEIATPVAIRMPISRPSVISVVTTPNSEQAPQKFSIKNINTIMINPPQPRPQRTDSITTPQSSKSSGFLAHEARSVEALTPSSASVISVTPSSSQSLMSTEYSVADNSLKKKQSTPMLTRAHARMNSIKNFIKPQSISGPPPAVPMIPTSHQPRPSESLSNILLSSVSPNKSKPLTIDNQDRLMNRRSLTEPAMLKVMPKDSRPQTARTTSRTSIMTQEPPLPVDASISTPPAEPVTPLEQVDSASISRKKSFSNLRRRSGSLGQALKFSSSKTKSSASEVPPPPVPAIKISPNESVPISLPTSAPKTPRTYRKSAMNLYSAFPPPIQRGDPVGLGLRM